MAGPQCPDLCHRWRSGAEEHELRLVRVPGTGAEPYLFGAESHRRPVTVGDFHLSTTPVTRALWAHVMGEPEPERPRHPKDEVSWDHIRAPGGFLDRLNAGPILRAITGDSARRFRLPSETEWEYAARGGPHWRDGFRFSGSNDPDAVAWFGARWSGGALKWSTLKWLKYLGVWNAQRHGRGPTQTHEVASKAPNQLGLYDLSGNVWEWCEDVCVEMDAVPLDGSPARGTGAAPEDEERRVRGGCHPNWDMHCTVWWRYGLTADFHDGCVGFRLALAEL
jgi:formylglycine-generating enzyme required for sulfatase activity